MVAITANGSEPPVDATLTPPDTQPAMCLLHGDFHAMGQACWSVALDWHLVHAGLDEQTALDAYLAEVERKMLDDHIRSLLCPAR